MTLKDLVKLRNYLNEISVTSTRLSINDLDGHVSRVEELPMHLDYKENVSELIHKLDKIEDLLDSIESGVPNIVSKIEQEIVERTKSYYGREYVINNKVINCGAEVEAERTERLMPMHDETRAEVLIKARKYTNWKYPTLEIGPGDGTWTEHLVAGDPLYIVDIRQEFLDSTLNRFNPVYRNRVRPYLIGAHGVNDTDLSFLPQNQFGFIFSWNVFNYFPLVQTKEFLIQSFNILRPGGYMMFSYNNCDIPQCAEFAEAGFKSWMTKSILTQECENAGFEIIGVYSLEDTVHWIEIKKPGELKTVKGHQVLGEIIHKPT